MLKWSLGKKLNEKSKITYKFRSDGFDRSGVKIPDFPIINILLEKPNGDKLSGPAIIDTGFDGPLFANEALTFFLADIPKENEKVIGGYGANEFTCELFKIEASIVDSNRKIVNRLGQIQVFIPIDLNYLSEYVIIGRELLNTIKICLDGRNTLFIP
jgi:hypothetical protein